MYPKVTPAGISFKLLRLNVFYGLILAIFLVFVIRLFYLQVIRHDYYQKAAFAGQFKEYKIPAERGVIYAKNGDQKVPIVLNEDVYTVFVDPKYVVDAKDSANKLAGVLKGDASKYESSMKSSTRYVVLAKKINKETAKKVDDLKIKGLGTRASSQRVYPQGSVGAQLLGFVDDEGSGKYGVEQYFNKDLEGQEGELKAITDARGIPLVSNKDNVLKDPVDGKDVNLTIDINMQKQTEDILKAHVESLRASGGSVVIMDPRNGEVKTMANYPSYDPSQFYKVEDPKVFNNNIVSEPLEPGSIMKTLTVAAGIDQGVISSGTTYYDPAQYKIDDAVVRNVEEDGGASTRSVSDILRYSLNTGATWVLMQMGGGQINQTAREKWHDYLVNHYKFGEKTGIEQGYEADGYVPDPNDGFGLNITYANSSFGQAINVTPIQMASAYSASINGGTYYKPHIIADKNAEVAKSDVISKGASEAMRGLHEKNVQLNYTFLKRGGYRIGGKTGTAQITKPGGGYYDDRFNGTFIGYIGGDTPEYVIMVDVKQPKVNTYAGIAAAAPLFEKTMNMLINNYTISKVK